MPARRVCLLGTRSLSACPACRPHVAAHAPASRRPLQFRPSPCCARLEEQPERRGLLLGCCHRWRQASLGGAAHAAPTPPPLQQCPSCAARATPACYQPLASPPPDCPAPGRGELATTMALLRRAPSSSPLPPLRGSYYLSLGILCGLILAAMPWAATGLSNQLGRARKENVSLAKLFQCAAHAAGPASGAGVCSTCAVPCLALVQRGLASHGAAGAPACPHTASPLHAVHSAAPPAGTSQT